MNKITMLAVVLTTASLSYTIGAFAPQSIIAQGAQTATAPVRGALNTLNPQSKAQNVNSYDENAFSSGQPQEMVMDLDGQDTAGVDFDGQDDVGIGAENIIGLNQY
jgi:hypothetical protein